MQTSREVDVRLGRQSGNVDAWRCGTFACARAYCEQLPGWKKSELVLSTATKHRYMFEGSYYLVYFSLCKPGNCML